MFPNRLPLDNVSPNLWSTKNRSDQLKNENHPIRQSRLEEFCQDTTIHGLKNILRSNQSIFGRVLWAIVFFGAVVACCILMILNIQRLFAYRIRTTSWMIIEDEIDFPAVTFCNENILRKSIVGANPNLIEEYVLSISGNSDQNDRQNSQAVKSCFTAIPSSLTENISLGYEYFRRVGFAKAAHDLSLHSDNSLLECHWRHANVNCSQYFLNHMTDFGWCFTLNPNPSLLRNFDIGFKPQDTAYGVTRDYEPLKITSTSFQQGFRLFLDVRQDEYCVTRSDAAGFRVSVHDSNVQPLFQIGKFISLTPGYEATVSISLTKIKKETESFGRCTNFTYLELFPDATIYYRDACFSQCFTNYIFENCHCVPIYGPPRARRIKSKETGRNIEMCWENVGAKCLKKHEEFFSLEGGFYHKCQCLDPCEHISYEPKVSLMYFPGDNFKDSYKRLVPRNRSNSNSTDDQEEYLKKNLISANFYVQSMQMLMILEEPEYTVVTLLGDVGGVIGGLLGMSVISLFEFVTCILPNRNRRH